MRWLPPLFLTACGPTTFTASAPARSMEPLVFESLDDAPAFEGALHYDGPEGQGGSTAFLQLEGTVELPENTTGSLEVLVDGTWPHESVDLADPSTSWSTSIEVPLACVGPTCEGERAFGFRLVAPEGGTMSWRVAAQASWVSALTMVSRPAWAMRTAVRPASCMSRSPS